MVWACDKKRRTPRRKEGDRNESTRGEKRGRPNRRWLDRMMDNITEKGLSWKVLPCYMEEYAMVHRSHIKCE